MSVKAVVGATAKAMFDHNVFAVIRIAGHEIRVHDFAICNGAHFIERFAAGVAMQAADIDPFVKSGVNEPDCGLDRITHKTILAAFPRRRFLSFVIALDVLIKRGATARKKSMVVGRQNKIERLVLRAHRGPHDEHDD